ncbi:hypothetical protein BDW68DRAFT_166898 [Aspergillus falconensis]
MAFGTILARISCRAMTHECNSLESKSTLRSITSLLLIVIAVTAPRPSSMKYTSGAGVDSMAICSGQAESALRCVRVPGR